MIWIIIGLLVFRWHILERFVGTKRMLLFDALMYTVFAAANFATQQVGGWMWFSYAVGVACIYWAYKSGKLFLKYDELMRIANEQEGKSDGGTASGS